jgi:hypothetical protein
MLGNTGSNDIRRFLIAYDGDVTPGHYGVDTVNHKVWAVLNHASEFASAAPEPYTFVWLASAALALGIGLRRGKSRRGKNNRRERDRRPAGTPPVGWLQ